MYLKRILVLFSCLVSFAANAQFNGMQFHHYHKNAFERYQDAKNSGNEFLIKWWQRDQLGFTYGVNTAKLVYDYHEDYFDKDVQGWTTFDTTVKINMHSKKSFGIVEGCFFPITEFGNKGVFDIAIDVAWNMTLFGGGEVALGRHKVSNFDVVNMDLGIPFTFEYKTGGDGFLDKSRKTMMTIGVGLHPRMLATGFSYLPAGETSGLKFVASPFVRAEVGFFAGIAWKLRATLYPGGTMYMSDKAEEGEGGLDRHVIHSRYSLQSQTSFNLSLILMPFSWDWEKKDGW